MLRGKELIQEHMFVLRTIQHLARLFREDYMEDGEDLDVLEYALEGFYQLLISAQEDEMWKDWERLVARYEYEDFKKDLDNGWIDVIAQRFESR